jgi:hypothetical protein
MRRYALFPLLLLLAGCAGWSGPRPYEVVEVVDPATVRVALPHGVETFHLQYVEPPAKDSEVWEAAKRRLVELSADGVDLELQAGFPLLRNNQGRLEVLLTGVDAAGEEAPINQTLLREGLGSFAPDPVGTMYREVFECEQAWVEAYRGRRGVYQDLTQEAAESLSADSAERTQKVFSELVKAPAQAGLEPVPRAMAMAALARATAILREHGQAAFPDQELVLADLAEIGRQAKVAPSPFAPAAAARVTAVAPRGTKVYLREELPSALHEEDVLTMVLVHELIHKVQYEAGLVSAGDGLPPPREEETRRHWGTSHDVARDAEGNLELNDEGKPFFRSTPALLMEDTANWYSEGHAHLWTGRVTRAAGLGETYARHRYGAEPLRMGVPYMEGAAFWRWAYDRLEDAGVRPTLAQGENDLVDRLHAALLGADRPRAPHVLLEADRWLAERVEGFPAPPYRLEHVGRFEGDQEDFYGDAIRIEWRLVAERPLFVDLRRQALNRERWDGTAWRWTGGSEESHAVERFLLGAGESRSFVILLGDPEDVEAGSYRLQAVLEGMLISFPEEGQPGVPLIHGRLTSPWIEEAIEGGE